MFYNMFSKKLSLKYLQLRVVSSHQGYGRAFYLAHRKSLLFNHFSKLIRKLPSNASNEIHRQIRTIIFSHVSAQKTAKTVDDKLMNARFRPVFDQKRHQRRQESIRLRLAINPVDNFRRREREAVEQIRAQIIAKLALQCIAYKPTAKNRTTAFIAQNPTQRRHISHNVMAIVETRI